MNTLLEQATPRPWAVAEHAYDFEPGPGWYVTGNGDEDYAAYCGPTQTNAYAGKADAELIVRAVNAYEPLVKALREAIPLVEDEWIGTHEDSAGNEWLRAARAALAAVESSPEREGGE